MKKGMKKRIASVMTVIVLVVCMLPVTSMTALAGYTPGDDIIIIESTTEDFSKNVSELIPSGKGTVSYVKDTGTLTLTDVEVVSGKKYFIRTDSEFNSELRIVLNGNNKVYSSYQGTMDDVAVGILNSSNGSLTITGPGSLLISMDTTAERTAGIQTTGDATIESVVDIRATHGILTSNSVNVLFRGFLSVNASKTAFRLQQFKLDDRSNAMAQADIAVFESPDRGVTKFEFAGRRCYYNTDKTKNYSRVSGAPIPTDIQEAKCFWTFEPGLEDYFKEPVTPGEVKDISQKADTTKENVLPVSIDSTTDLKGTLKFTDSQMAEGINVWAKAETRELSDSQKELIKNLVDGSQVIVSTDLSLFYRVGNNEVQQVSELDETLGLKIDEKLLIDEGKKQLEKERNEFSISLRTPKPHVTLSNLNKVINIHNGKANELKASIVGKDLTVHTSQFSPYIFVFDVIEVPEESTDVPATLDINNIGFVLSVFVLSGFGLFVLKKRDEFFG